MARLGPLMAELLFAMRRASGTVPEELRAAGRLGGRHVAALGMLSAIGPLTVGELADRLGISLAHASLVVGDLARAGLVERRADERDRRRTIVSVAPERAAAVAKMRRGAGRPMRAFLDTLDEAEADRFIDLLERLVETLRREATQGR